MDYKTYAPTQSLALFVKCYWTLKASATKPPEIQRIVPDGCMEMIFNDGDPYQQIAEDGKRIQQPRCFVFGQITSPLDIIPTGVTGIFAVRFHPDGFAPFTTLPLRNLDNRAVPLSELYGQAGVELEKNMLATPTTTTRIAAVESFLLNRLKTPEAIDALSKSSVDILLRTKGQVSIDDLAGQLNTNRRQLERAFSSVIGLSPKQLSKIIRLQATLRLMEQKQFTSLTSLAHESGYFDQAHFIKDFREFTGMSPRQFYGDNIRLSALFIGTE